MPSWTPQGPASLLCCSTPPLQVPRVSSLRRAAILALPASGTATGPLGIGGVFCISHVSRVQRGKYQEKMKGISIPSCALLGRRWAFPCQGTSEPALRLPACLSVWFRKTSPKKPGRRQVQRQGGKNFFFFLQGVCVPVCVSILSGGCPHLCSFQKSPDAVPRAYKASFSIRKETAVKAADGLALRGPELGLITLLLPGMILVVSSVKHMLNSLELLVFNPCSWTDVQVVMTLVPRLVLSLRSSGKEGVFSTRGACVAWNEGFFGDRFTSVPLPKAWMAFRRHGFSVKSLRNFSHSSSRFPLPRQLHQGDTTMPAGLEST